MRRPAQVATGGWVMSSQMESFVGIYTRAELCISGLGTAFSGPLFRIHIFLGKYKLILINLV